jgi:hypothetical protein
MHIVAIYNWKEETTELVKTLAITLGITVFEARPRMIGGGPTVVASFADPGLAMALADKLNKGGFATMVIDAALVRGKSGHFVVRRFELNEWSLHLETSDGQQAEIPYEEIDLLLAGTSIVASSETITVTERKLSLGKTILSGGIPITRKIERKEEITTEERGKVLYLYAGRRPQVFFSQNCMSYDGLGAAMKHSRELNFSHLVSELRRVCQEAGFDDRLLTRINQVRLLGPSLNPEKNLDLSAEILARSLLGERFRLGTNHSP